MSSAICVDSDQSRILSSGNELRSGRSFLPLSVSLHFFFFSVQNDNDKKSKTITNAL